MPLILGANSLAGGGYEIDNSLRFNSGSSDFLNVTNSTPTNNDKCTLSVWVKRSALGGTKAIMGFHTNDDNRGNFVFDADKLDLIIYDSGSVTTNLITSQLFRDVSAWYHIVLAVDTTQATASNRVRIYVNGTEVTSFGTETNPSQNQNFGFNNSGIVLKIGQKGENNDYFNGYMSEVNFIDGQQLAPSDFGEFDQDSGIWKPIAYTGTYGTNGFYLEFKDSSALGDDTSGNSNDFTVNNLTSIDQTTDTPTNNFATWNPLARNASNTYSEGNLGYSYANSYHKSTISNIGTENMKIYAEFKRGGTATQNFGIVCDNYASDGRCVTSTSEDFTYDMVGHTGAIVLRTNSTSGNSINVDGSASGTTVDFYSTTNDIIMIAFDPTTKKIWFGKNGTWSNSGNPATDTSPTITYSGTGNAPFYFGVGSEDGLLILANFGNPPFTISSGNSDANGYGLFEYQPPSGYLALCTKNLATDG